MKLILDLIATLALLFIIFTNLYLWAVIAGG